MKELTSRQKAFADYYLELGNATEAARRAGYKGNNLNRVASENLTKLGIKQYIEERQKQIDSKRIATIEEVMRFYTAVMRGEVKDQFELDAELKDRLAAGKELMKRLELSEDKMSDGGGIEIINDAPTD
ncbi:terminase small subunit [Bariatricus massiliensis]|uniref:Terminase small subunit n=1 Tax=Bariatricus massiliensis TaxID=1745713 RepID=A0ABS8DH20_9FIRM|nr:terminase small subunit [Bariatricus massiliensis]MCB7306175.1 terminase small subunit [Bariatricus massiliensis]MCB7375253.1 terminase small subunit [Bariatricus massiliensis]MCB7387713.1 terminase small subunit [Bariatricus massiliensis]MCB7411874.1 terminase small subunit [Bariatricus massiliensis]MCQ5254011.1 terminase small subunit [Bariatricus massiliensis]